MKVEHTREKCVQAGLEAALNHTRPQKKRFKALNGDAKAPLVQLACTKAREGHGSWTR